MALSVGVANPAGISNVGVATPPRITNVGVALPPRINGVDIAHPGTLGPVSNGGPSLTLTQTNPTLNGTSSGTGVPPPVYAPKLDIASVNARARSQAEGAVNPFYTKQLNDFLAQQAELKRQQEEQYTTNIQNYQDALKNTTEANAIAGTRAAEDSATKQTAINTANDQNQVDTGTQFEDARLAAAKQQAVGGTLGTGAGNNQTTAQTTNRNTTEGRQNDAFQIQRDQQEQFKSRTFEDLARSTSLATSAEGKSEKQAKFDLDNYIKGTAFTEQNKRNELEQSRLERIASEQRNQAKLLFNNYLAGISNPAQYEAAVRTYGGAF